MAPVLVPDSLWGLIELLLPGSLPKPHGGRPRVSDRLPRGHHFRTPKWCPMADAAKNAGLRFRHDLLAAPARLAAERDLGFDPFRILGLALA